MKLFLILVEGQLYLLAVLAIFVAEVALLVWGLLSRRPLLGLLAVFGTVPLMRTTLGSIRTLFFRIHPPDGVTLDRPAAPRLHDLVEEIRRAVGAPPIHHVTVSWGFDASAITHWQWWPFGRRRTLVLGLPVLASLSSA